MVLPSNRIADPVASCINNCGCVSIRARETSSRTHTREETNNFSYKKKEHMAKTVKTAQQQDTETKKKKSPPTAAKTTAQGKKAPQEKKGIKREREEGGLKKAPPAKKQRAEKEEARVKKETTGKKKLSDVKKEEGGEEKPKQKSHVRHMMIQDLVKLTRARRTLVNSVRTLLIEKGYPDVKINVTTEALEKMREYLQKKTCMYIAAAREVAGSVDRKLLKEVHYNAVSAVLDLNKKDVNVQEKLLATVKERIRKKKSTNQEDGEGKKAQKKAKKGREEQSTKDNDVEMTAKNDETVADTKEEVQDAKTEERNE